MPTKPASTDPLRAAGLRRTAARVTVLERIGALAAPLSHAELAALPELAGMDGITLYRTLAALEEARLVHRVIGIDGVWRFAAQPGSSVGCPGNHVHFLCTDCGAMSCLRDQPMPRVRPPAGAEVRGRQALAFGSCAACVSGARVGSTEQAGEGS